MKKLFSILAVVCMGFFALALTSCGGDDDPSTDTDWEGLNIDGLKCFDTGNHLDEGGLYMHGLWSGPTSESKNVYAILYQMEFKEIADTTNVSINTALGRMRYAIINLRRMAQEYQMELRMM